MQERRQQVSGVAANASVHIPSAQYKLDSHRQVEEKKTIEMSEMKYLGVVGK